MYSTIRTKYGVCEDCTDGKEKLIKAVGKCPYHYAIHLQVKSYNKRKIKMEAEREQYGKLSDWYKEKMEKSPRYCENCGASLKHYNEKDWHGSQHHILEKSLFQSVRCHPDNHLVLGKWCCHSIVTDFSPEIKNMKVYELAKQRLQTVIPCIDKKELRRLPEYFK